MSILSEIEKEGKLGAFAMKRVAAGVFLLTPWLFKTAERPDDKIDYCLIHGVSNMSNAPKDVFGIP